MLSNAPMTITQDVMNSGVNDYENQKAWLVRAYESVDKPEKMTGTRKRYLYSFAQSSWPHCID